MKIESGKWFVYKSRVYAVIKSFETSQIHRLSKSTNSDTIVAYMVRQRIVRQQASLDYRLSRLFTFIPFAENEK